MKRIVEDEAKALREEFGEGASLFAHGQIVAAQRAGEPAAAVFWSAVLEAVTTPQEDAGANEPAAREAEQATVAQSSHFQIQSEDFPAPRWSLRRMAARRMRGAWRGHPRFALRY